MGISKWNAGVIRPVAVAPTGPFQNSSAPGVWTLDQQAYWQKQGLWPTAGSVDPSAFIENLFSTYLYTGTSGSNTITNGIDLSTKGGLVWVKSRSGASSGSNHILQDTVRGANKQLRSNTTGSETSDAVNWSFNSSGFSMNTSISYLNDSGTNYASWTFREQPKFFDVVTYTGTGSVQNIPHNLGSVPGCILIKLSNGGSNWRVYHRSIGATNLLILNDTSASTAGATTWNNTAPTSTVFTVGTDGSVNENGFSFVAYLFAHDAGGFGLTGTDNVISCGSYTTNASAKATINLGYEPQWVLVKKSSGADGWYLMDTMRGFAYSNTALGLQAQSSQAESAMSSGANGVYPTATGFEDNGTFAVNSTFIYIAIRRGPMKVPTTGTSVFQPTAPANGTGTATSISGLNFSPDLMINLGLSSGIGKSVFDRLRGRYLQLLTDETGAEVSRTDTVTGFDLQNGVLIGNGASGYVNNASYSYNNLFFQRAPGFFDEVITPSVYTTGIVNHNLTVVPELMIEKTRSTSTTDWRVYHKDIAAGGALNLADAFDKSLYPRNPTSTTFEYGNNNAVDYLFATCAGVSKVGSYTGTGALQTINCGFAAGARFVLIKRTDSTGAWYVWDSARGISSGNDPYTLLNTNAAQVTGTNYVDTTAVGFQVTAAAPAALNASGGTYIFLAVA